MNALTDPSQLADGYGYRSRIHKRLRRFVGRRYDGVPLRAALPDRLTEVWIGKQLDAQRALEWRRVAPGGRSLWLMSDDDLAAEISRLERLGGPRTVAFTYLLVEQDRRAQRRLHEVMAEANRRMVTLTWAVVSLTVLVVVLTAISTYAVITH